MEEEVWKDVVGYEGNYLVSNLGRIKTVLHIVTYKGRSYISKERIMSLQYDAYGYLQVRLSKDAVKKTQKVHRIVAIAFIPNPNNLPEINHKDEIKTNNRVGNLEWCDRKYNMQYGVNTHWHRMPVAQYSLDGVFIKQYSSIKQASIETGICDTSIGKCATKRVVDKKRGTIAKTSGGYIWKLI